MLGLLSTDRFIAIILNNFNLRHNQNFSPFIDFIQLPWQLCGHSARLFPLFLQYLFLWS
jgi:hypothetical protein